MQTQTDENENEKSVDKGATFNCDRVDRIDKSMARFFRSLSVVAAAIAASRETTTTTTYI